MPSRGVGGRGGRRRARRFRLKEQVLTAQKQENREGRTAEEGSQEKWWELGPQRKRTNLAGAWIDRRSRNGIVSKGMT